MSGATPAEVFVNGLSLIVLLACLVIEVWALIHCALQRADAFTAVGTLTKGLWLALLGGTITQLVASLGTWMWRAPLSTAAVSDAKSRATTCPGICSARSAAL